MAAKDDVIYVHFSTLFKKFFYIFKKIEQIFLSHVKFTILEKKVTKIICLGYLYATC